MKRWRTKANVSREQLAEAANYSPDTIKSMEQGVRMPTPRVLDVADELCRAEGLLSAAKEYLQREKFPKRARDFMEREKEAISFWSHESGLIPGLLQAPRYMRALIEGRVPPLDEETIESRIAGRVERQAMLTAGKPPVAFAFTLYEAVLHAPHVDGEQLHRLLEVSRLRNVVLQVLPFKLATLSAAMGTMILLETRDHERFAYTESQFVSDLSADPEVVRLVTERLSMMRAHALSPAESARFIERMADHHD
ncbi:helix-turn-helix transcriptional regulator [Streptomyces sp. AC602_WCS936]|uniref:helix-turn-helix domain-containing protein n=1 Tax=Streptomyces sp. AC602_WCS936 TaxID=2823685 RepID=UPI001C27D089|nr:helix-turn-helix transcriptional regulator [Streptomyces sp. AC602_WCS936]